MRRPTQTKRGIKDIQTSFKELTVISMKSPDGSEASLRIGALREGSENANLGMRGREAFAAGGGGGRTCSPAG